MRICVPMLLLLSALEWKCREDAWVLVCVWLPRLVPLGLQYLWLRVGLLDVWLWPWSGTRLLALRAASVAGAAGIPGTVLFTPRAAAPADPGAAAGAAMGEVRSASLAWTSGDASVGRRRPTRSSTRSGLS